MEILMTKQEIEAARTHYEASLAARRITRFEYQGFIEALDRIEKTPR
jgi:hypothetical protein